MYKHYYSTHNPITMKKLLSAVCMVSVSFLFFSCQKQDLSDLTLDTDLNSRDSLSIGQEYQGGIIFYLDSTGKHGLIASKEDLGPATWGCYGISIPGAQSRDDGYSNTQAILAACNEPGIAARLCDEYVVLVNGKKYDDWFLPALNQAFNIASIKGNYGLCGKTYSVSSEASDSFYGVPVKSENVIWGAGVSCNEDKTLITGMHLTVRPKTSPVLVRPVRVF